MHLRSLAKTLVLAGAAGLAFALLLAAAVVRSGVYDVGASSPHTRLTEWLTHETMIHSVRLHARGIAAPRQFTAEQVEAGFCAYETHCVACHGAAGIAREQWVSGLEPAPPYLLDIHQRFRPAELFWIARNGIKMTGMPSWKNEMSEGEIWNVVAWLEASAKLPPQTYRQWRAQRTCSVQPEEALPAP